VFGFFPFCFFFFLFFLGHINPMSIFFASVCSFSQLFFFLFSLQSWYANLPRIPLSIFGSDLFCSPSSSLVINAFFPDISCLMRGKHFPFSGFHLRRLCRVPLPFPFGEPSVPPFPFYLLGNTQFFCFVYCVVVGLDLSFPPLNTQFPLGTLVSVH